MGMHATSGTGSLCSMWQIGDGTGSTEANRAENGAADQAEGSEC